MKALIQRVKKASVDIDSKRFSEINEGLLVFLGVVKGDEKINAEKLADKIINLRIFEDEEGKMNKSILSVGGDILVVSQFTLCGDCKKGTRPSFDNSAPVDIARNLYEYFVKYLKDNSPLKIETGQFQAEMQVSLINDGPVTFLIEK